MDNYFGRCICVLKFGGVVGLGELITFKVVSQKYSKLVLVGFLVVIQRSVAGSE